MARIKALVTNWAPYITVATIALISALTITPQHAASAQLVVDPMKAIHWEAEGMWINGRRWDATPNTAVAQGTVMTLSCTWSIRLISGTYWKTERDLIVPINIKHNGAVFTSGSMVIPAGTWLGVKVTHSGSIFTFNATSTATNSPYGDRFRKEFGPFSWTATGGGMHTFQCELPQVPSTTETRVNVTHTVTPSEWKK
jgi:hypothetical protein